MSEFTTELNRLAGTVGLDAAYAANVLAGTTQLDLVGALNVIAGTTGLEFNGVVKAIAVMYGDDSSLDANGALVDSLLIPLYPLINLYPSPTLFP
jgi:hypothetical protein